ncbi:cytochrome P450 4V3 [Hypoxylon sp. FL1150]|nr:cytochrome P450 4V3 [Hypoxylon sp. FL1150]
MEWHSTDAVRPLLLRGVSVLLAIAVFRFLYRGYVERSRVRSLRARGIPILPHSIWFGHLPIFADFRAEHPPDVNIYMFHLWLAANYKKYFPQLDKVPPVIYLDLWPAADSLVSVVDPVAASQFTIVQSLPKHSVATEFMYPLTGNVDIVSSEGELWKKWRSRFSPGFSPRNLTALLPELIEEAQVFVDGLKGLAGKNEEWGPVFQLEEKTTNLTFDIIVRASVDLRLHEQSRSTPSPLKKALMNQIELMGMMANAARVFLPIGRMPWHHAAIKKNNRVMRDALIPQIEDKLQSDFRTDLKKKTIVDLAIKHIDKDGQSASREKPDTEFVERLIANLKAFIFAGHDTTSSTICYMVKMLQDHPDCLEKFRAEHDAVLGTNPDDAVQVLTASPHLLYSLPYTLAVIKETLRLYPLAATVRSTTSTPDFYLTVPGSPQRYPIDGFGPWVAVPAVQRNPDYWPRPDEFLPERWLVAEGDPLYAAKEAWVPFSSGPRNCIGMELAMIELRLVAVLIARTFDIEEAWDEWDVKQ